MLDGFAKRCTLKEDPTVAHKVNQKLLNNTEIVSTCLDIITSEEQLPAVLISVYNFLSCICYSKYFTIIH